MITLETERLILRPWKGKDAETLFRYASNPAVGPIAGWPAHTSVRESHRIIHKILSAREIYAVVPKKEGHPVGCVGLLIGKRSNLKIPKTEAEIGFWLGVPFWGRGMIPEAVREMMHHAFCDLEMRCLWCGYFDGNLRSKRVQEKCGFHYHHTIDRAPTAIKGDFRTEHVSCITKEDWEMRFRCPAELLQSRSDNPTGTT